MIETKIVQWSEKSILSLDYMKSMAGKAAGIRKSLKSVVRIMNIRLGLFSFSFSFLFYFPFISYSET